MNIEDLQSICKALPGVTEDIKWGHDLAYSIGSKMFCVTGLDESPVTACIKVTESEFDELSGKQGFIPAPYLAKHKWILVEDINILKKAELERLIQQSYQLIKSKLPAKLKKEIDLL